MGNSAGLSVANCVPLRQAGLCPFTEPREPRPQGMLPAPCHRQGDMHSMSHTMGPAALGPAMGGSPKTTNKILDGVNPMESTDASGFDTRTSSRPHGHLASSVYTTGDASPWDSAASSVFGSYSLDPFLAAKQGLGHGSVAFPAARMGSALFAGSARYYDPMQSAPTFSAVGVQGAPPPPTWGGMPMIPARAPPMETQPSTCFCCC